MPLGVVSEKLSGRLSGGLYMLPVSLVYSQLPPASLPPWEPEILTALSDFPSGSEFRKGRHLLWTLMKVLVLLNEGAYKPHTICPDSGEGNLMSIVHQKCSPTFCLYFRYFQYYLCSSCACAECFISKKPNEGLWDISN